MTSNPSEKSQSPLYLVPRQQERRQSVRRMESSPLRTRLHELRISFDQQCEELIDWWCFRMDELVKALRVA